MTRSILWFRKGLRLHDNRALLEACRGPVTAVFPVFIIDPNIIPSVGVNRLKFLLESLQDLDEQLLSKCHSRLLVLKGNPLDVLPELWKQWNIDRISFEYDSEPYALKRDNTIKKLAEEADVEVCTPVGHTLFTLTDILDQTKDGKPPVSYAGFLTTVKKLGEPEKPVDLDEILSSVDGVLPGEIAEKVFDPTVHSVPKMTDLGLKEISKAAHTPFYGGETVALKRLEAYLANKTKVLTFAKPDTAPTDFNPPSTTVLSPYLKFGCLSVRTFYYRLKDILDKSKKHTDPPVSLMGQLYWREFFYCNGFGIRGFDSMEKNRICLQVPWDNNDELVAAWKEARTGYPWIDACMNQLRTEGWMHHLARHAVACFLTRGDLWQSWEKGRDVFDELLLDADWSLNNANWLWLSASAFYHQYFRVYSPISFPKKTDPTGEFVKRYVPQLKNYPAKYIYEPWKAPLSVQKQAGCIIGKDYPNPIVDHQKASKQNIAKMKQAYENKNYGVYTEPSASDTPVVTGRRAEKRKLVIKSDSKSKKQKTV